MQQPVWKLTEVGYVKMKESISMASMVGPAWRLTKTNPFKLRMEQGGHH